MGNENGVWIMRGMEKNDPRRARTAEQLIGQIEAAGFLPLFRNGIPGFSVEERTLASDWWTGDPERDPWEWRELLARSGRVAYGKFFDKKAGFLSREWLPYFANFRRNGYDFDALWDDGKAHYRSRKLMDCFRDRPELFSFELKELAGFGKGGEPNFEGAVTALQMQLYLTVRDFRQRRNRGGLPYGWAIAVYAPPEELWGYEAVTAAYAESPERSGERILRRMEELYPIPDRRAAERLIREGRIR